VFANPLSAHFALTHADTAIDAPFPTRLLALFVYGVMGYT
jgi:hypothetical protein